MPRFDRAMLAPVKNGFRRMCRATDLAAKARLVG
jgi:hypothetical protein